jgi:mannose-6-phosphate isomerase-like protein (cupin superfamily)
MEFGFTAETPKEDVFKTIAEYLSGLDITVGSVDAERPWGGFFVIDESSTDKFITQFFPDYDIDSIKQFGSKLSPKILVVGPEEELSWQYHFRRAELWRCVEGPVGFKRSKDDVQSDINTLDNGQIVQFDPSERHRLVGLHNWGIVAEFWQHTDPNQPSDEDDIVRLDDKYGR